MRLIQLTDIHIAKENEHPYDVDVRENFLKLLDAIADETFDALVLTGDLCLDNPSESVYKWIRSQLEKNLPASVLHAIPGNHDDPHMLANHFNLNHFMKEGELYYQASVSGEMVILLDTAKGYSSEEQKNWLDQTISSSKNDMHLVFMHHPPCDCQLPHMDRNYSLKDKDEYMKIFQSYPGKQFRVFSGHYHTDRTVYDKNVAVHLTPSSYVQIDDRYDKFMPEHYRPGYRIIDLTEGILLTRIKYI